MPALATLPTELTTAATDLLLAVAALLALLCLQPLRSRERFTVGLWQALFALLGVAALLGTLSHGLQFSPRVDLLLWQPLNLAMGLAVALFVLAAVGDGFGTAAARRGLRPALALGAGFYLATLLLPGGFLLFVIYEGLALLFVLSLYLRLAFIRHRPGSGLLAAGVLVTLLAAALQASPVSFTLVLTFDHNGIFHLVQLPGIALLVAGVRRSVTTLPAR